MYKCLSNNTFVWLKTIMNRIRKFLLASCRAALFRRAVWLQFKLLKLWVSSQAFPALQLVPVLKSSSGDSPVTEWRRTCIRKKRPICRFSDACLKITIDEIRVGANETTKRQSTFITFSETQQMNKQCVRKEWGERSIANYWNNATWSSFQYPVTVFNKMGKSLCSFMQMSFKSL